MVALGIEHVRFEIDGRVLGSDLVQIARWRMTFVAAASAIEECFTGVGIAGEQLLDWIGFGHTVRTLVLRRRAREEMPRYRSLAHPLAASQACPCPAGRDESHHR